MKLSFNFEGTKIDYDLTYKKRTSIAINVDEDGGATSVHLSAKTLRPSLSTHKNPQVYMGLPSIDESIIYETNPEEVKAARKVLETL